MCKKVWSAIIIAIMVLLIPLALLVLECIETFKEEKPDERDGL